MLESSLQSHKRHYKTVFIGWRVATKLSIIFKIGARLIVGVEYCGDITYQQLFHQKKNKFISAVQSSLINISSVIIKYFQSTQINIKYIFNYFFLSINVASEICFVRFETKNVHKSIHLVF